MLLLLVVGRKPSLREERPVLLELVGVKLRQIRLLGSFERPGPLNVRLAEGVHAKLREGIAVLLVLRAWRGWRAHGRRVMEGVLLLPWLLSE